MCSHPQCGVTNQLHKIPKNFRYKITIEEGVYIPPNAIACNNHIEVAVWKNVNLLIESEHEFTKGFIEDMFKLLSKPSTKSGAPKESSMNFFFQSVYV